MTDFVADLHLHSKFSRAVSPSMTLPVMAQFAKKKGLDILSTSDWTHPIWFREIKAQLEEAEEGLFRIKNDERGTRFLLSVEISSIYSQGGKVRRIHNLIWSPSLVTCEKITKELIKRGCNLGSDGRAIIGLSAKQLIELVLGIDDKAMLIPCHAWTPWFSLYGSNSGFDSIEECFGDYSKYIYAIETGLSSDPEMNWRIKELENRAIISCSDAHSPMKMGREATVFRLNELSYTTICDAIKRKNDKNKILYTIEFYPEEGKYHYTGHRNCKVIQTTEETKKSNICPVCHKKLTVGVMHRVEDLAKVDVKGVTQNNSQGLKWIKDPKGIHPPYVKLVPLHEIIAESLFSTVVSKKVLELYNTLCEQFGSEMQILLKTPTADIAKINPRLAQGIDKVRRGDIYIRPGFDGEYGIVKIWSDDEKADAKNKDVKPQKLF